MPRSTFEMTPVEILLPSETLTDYSLPGRGQAPRPRPDTDSWRPRGFWPTFLMVLLRALSAWEI